VLPCVIFEDEHLLVVNKPAGMNTHAPSPFAGEGIYEWLRHREPRWSGLAILHRLDKETSGVMVFGKTAAANRALTDQFSRRVVRKKYLLLTDRPVKQRDLSVRSNILRAGERYASGPGGEPAETRFRVRAEQPRFKDRRASGSEIHVVEAEPLTGRTHQIRVHAAEKGFPILGDTLYGGSPFDRVCLHAEELAIRHPDNGKELVFRAPVDFLADARLALRSLLVDPRMTNAFRVVHGASDGWRGWYVDRLGEFCVSQSEAELSESQLDYLKGLGGVRGLYHKILNRQVRRASQTESSPQLVWGEAAPERFSIRENGVEFELSFNEGYSVGLFLDQRDNRRRLLATHVADGFPLIAPRTDPGAPLEMLNAFAYTCGFSVCAAKAGIRATSLDLSKKYLEWGRRNFILNHLDPAAHDFIYGDVFDWLRRLGKKGRTFDLIALDPPTFSQSKEHGVFRVEKDYGRLIALALPLLRPGGVLFASTNAAEWRAEEFLEIVHDTVRLAKRRVLGQHYVPQPPDFPVSRTEPAYLKTVWLRLS
jgi:23S rRNA (cytosine1962-C5)-methyltransferase